MMTDEKIRLLFEKCTLDKANDKKLYDKYKITKENVVEAYPSIVWGNRS